MFDVISHEEAVEADCNRCNERGEGVGRLWGAW